MPQYLIQVAYTSEAWANQVKTPQDPVGRVGPVVEQLGGKMECAYYAFGEYDVVTIASFPDNVSAAAFSLAASAGGAVKAFKTTPLMSIDEGLQAMRKAGTTGYRPPSG